LSDPRYRERSGDGWVFNVHEDGAGRPNADLVDLATRVHGAVTPLAVEHDDYLTPTFAPDRFRGHLGADRDHSPLMPERVRRDDRCAGSWPVAGSR
jgi:hypothetical protein